MKLTFVFFFFSFLYLVCIFYCVTAQSTFTCPKWNLTIVDNMCKTLGVRMLPEGVTIQEGQQPEYKYIEDNCCYRLAYLNKDQIGYCTLNWDTDDGKVDMDWRASSPAWECLP